MENHSQEQCNMVGNNKSNNHSNNQLLDYTYDVRKIKIEWKYQESQYAIVDLGSSDHYMKQNIATIFAPKNKLKVISVKLLIGNTLH